MMHFNHAKLSGVISSDHRREFLPGSCFHFQVVASLSGAWAQAACIVALLDTVNLPSPQLLLKTKHFAQGSLTELVRCGCTEKHVICVDQKNVRRV